MASEETSFRCIHIKITSTSGKKKSDHIFQLYNCTRPKQYRL